MTSSDSDSKKSWKEETNKRPRYFERRHHRRIPRSTRTNYDKQRDRALNSYHDRTKDRKRRELHNQQPMHPPLEANDNLLSSLKDINNELSRIWSYMTNVYKRADRPQEEQLHPSISVR